MLYPCQRIYLSSVNQNKETCFAGNFEAGIKEYPLGATEELNGFLADVERRAFKMALIATANIDEALDVVQDAMLAFVKLYASRPAVEWGVLFHRSLQSRIIDWRRRAMVRNRFRGWLGCSDRGPDDEDPIATVADTTTPDPAEQMMRRDLGEAIENALRALPLRQQQAFLLRAWEGLDVAETAFAMGCSEGSVKTHYSRAVHTLRNRLEDFRR
jgi:RNA polymerase sigma-70 factor (ECF subfamily)